MKTVELGQVSPEISRVLDDARGEDVIVRLPDGSEFLVVAVDESDREVAAMRGNEKLMELLDARAKSQKRIPLADVKRRLGM